MESWPADLRDRLPGLVPAEEYVTRTAAAAAAVGLVPADTLPLVATCRDELMVGFGHLVERAWGPSFSIGSLGGLVLAGVSGIAAAVGHAPDTDLRRFVLYAMTHVGIDADGAVGPVQRPGQRDPSAACGALAGFLQELRSGELRLEYDRTDPEMSLLRTRLAPAVLRSGGVPDLLDLTALARDVALADVTEIGGITGPGRGAVAMFTGIVVHTPGRDLVAPHTSELRWPRELGRPADPLRW